MERGVTEFLNVEKEYHPPYNNHYGYGLSVGCGDSTGKGRAFIEFLPEYNDAYSGSDILSFNNHPTYMIDDYLVYITHCHAPWVLGEIINNDFTTQSCYMAKVNDKYVVGNSIREVIEGMREKIFENGDNNEDIARAFVLAHPDYEKQYDWDEMVTWHSLSHFSCSDGRRDFTKSANMGSGKTATPRELIKHMKNSVSRDIAEKMERIYLYKD